MQFRKIFVALAALAALSVAAAGAAWAQSAEQHALIRAAKDRGEVGEQVDGFLGFRVSSTDPALNTAVRVTNDARRAGYAQIAARNGLTVEVVGAAAFESEARPRMSTGHWWRDASGTWVRR